MDEERVPDALMEKFTDVLRRRDVDGFLMLFSPSSPWTYVGTLTDPHETTRITYEDLARDLRNRSGWYETLFDARGDDCFRDHVTATKGKPWRRVGSARFVPPDDRGDGRVYVSWRSEGAGRWVVDEIGEPSA